MSAVVTGGAGFIGRHLVEALCAAGGVAGRVVVLDNLRRGQREVLAARIADGGVRFVEGDVRDPAAVAEALAGAEVVFHLAAQANVMGAEEDADYAFTTNVVGTRVVLEAARNAGVRRVVLASSREVYGQPASLPVAETAPLLPRNVYGASKAAGEMLARAEAARGTLEVVALRLANVYGLGDTGRVLPLWLERAARGEELVIYGGAQVLDLIWVGDVVDAFLQAGRLPIARLAAAGAGGVGSGSGERFAALNVGTGEGTAIRAIAEQVRVAVGRYVPVRVAAPRAAEVERYVADVRLMRAALRLAPAAPLAHLPAMAQRALADARQPVTADVVTRGHAT